MMKFVSAALAAVLIPAGACAAAPAAMVTDNGPLWRADGGGAAPAPGSVSMTSGACWWVVVSLRLDPSAPKAPPPSIKGSPSPCQSPSVYIGYLADTLFIEGLDAKGARLFVATGSNPLHQTAELPPGIGGGALHQSTDRPAPRADTLISVPVTAPLARLRWYPLDSSQQPHLLGETAWVPVPPPSR